MNTEILPGRELDALVAEKVMGCDVGRRTIPYGSKVWTTEPGQEAKVNQREIAVYPCCCIPLHIHNDETGQVPHYSTDIAAAWEVLIALRDRIKKKCELSAAIAYDINSDTVQSCVIVTLFDENRHIGPIDAAPHAICLAALKAVAP